MPKTVTMGNFCYPKGISSNNCLLAQWNILKWLLFLNIYEDIQANPSPENTGSPQFHVERTNNICTKMQHEPETFGPREKMSLNACNKVKNIYSKYRSRNPRPPREIIDVKCLDYPLKGRLNILYLKYFNNIMQHLYRKCSDLNYFIHVTKPNVVYNIYVKIYIFAMSKVSEHILKTLGPYGMLTFIILIIYIKYINRYRVYGYYKQFVMSKVSKNFPNSICILCL